MTYVIHWHADRRQDDLREPLSHIARASLARTKSPSGELTLVLVGSDRIRSLNAEFRKLDVPTDVLSFPDGSIDPDTGGVYFGDVILAVPIARKQAERAGHPLLTELSLLTVHGVLHLIGYDHDEKANQKSMWDLQSAILEDQGIRVSLAP